MLFTTIGITGNTAFLAGAAEAAVITTGGALTGSMITVHGMNNRTQQAQMFEILWLRNNKHVNFILYFSVKLTNLAVLSGS